jgi:signal peptidase I
MEPNFHQGDFIIVDKVTSKIGSFKRGDIIVFVPKGKDVPYIKRIIGMPGETVKIANNEIRICDGLGQGCTKLEESYIPGNFKTEARCGKDSFTIGPNAYFAMGDHRGHSTDSSCCF